MVSKARQKRFLRLDDFPARYRQRKPSPCIHLWELTDIARPWWPLQLECIASKSGRVKVALYRPGLDELRAGLFHLAQRYEIPVNRNARFFLKFPLGGSKGVFVSGILAFGDGPRARILPRPKRAAWMYEEYL